MESNKRYYAIVINTHTTETNNDIGMVDGKIVYVTERLARTTIGELPDETTYTNVYSEFLKQNGINKTTQKIDIINGGDYSNLNSFGFSIINTALNGETYTSEIDALTEAYIIGADVQYFVCTMVDGDNDIWIPKWTGIISNYSPGDTYISFSCIDKFMKEYQMMPKTTTSNNDSAEDIPVILGDNKFSKPVTILNERIVDDTYKSRTVLRIKPNCQENVTFKWELDYSQGYLRKISNPTSLPPGYIHSQQGASDTNLIPDFEHGNEMWGPYVARGEPLSYKHPNQYDNGITWAVLTNKVSGVMGTVPSDDYIGKYIQFSEKRTPSDQDIADGTLYKIVGVDLWGAPEYTPEGWKGYTYDVFIIEEAPEGFTDRTVFYGDGYGTDATNGGTSHGGEIVNDSTLYFSIIEVKDRIVISNSPISSLSTINTLTDFVYPSDELKVYTKGAIKEIITTLPTNDIQLDVDNPYINIAGSKYTGGKIPSYIFMKPKNGYWENIEVDYADNTGYRQNLSNSLNDDPTTFDWVAPGLHSDWVGTDMPNGNSLNPGDSFKYCKSNIHLAFDKSAFDIEDYDEYYLMPNFDRPSNLSVFKDIIEYTEPYTPPVTGWDANANNTGNCSAYYYSLEIRNSVTTSEGIRYTPNFNDLNHYLYFPLGLIENTNDNILANNNEYAKYEFKRVVTIPFKLIPWSGEQSGLTGFLNTFPKQMGWEYYDDDYNEHDRFWANQIAFDTEGSLKFNKELFTVNPADEDYNLILSMTPYTYDIVTLDTANMTPTWDTIRLYNVGIMLRKDISINDDIYLKVKGETLENDTPEPTRYEFTVMHTDNNDLDGVYIWNGSEYICSSTRGGYVGVIGLETILGQLSWVLSADIGSGPLIYYVISSSDTYSGPAIGLLTPTTESVRTASMSKNSPAESVEVTATSAPQLVGTYYKVTDELYQKYDGANSAGLQLSSTRWGAGTILGTTLPRVSEEYIYNSTEIPIPNGEWEGLYSTDSITINAAINNIQTNNVYSALKHIVNTYTNIDTVDYHNLESTRSDWNVGRQISTKKNSFEYVRELCKQSFISGWVAGDGSVNFNSFRERLANDDTLVLHSTKDLIIDNSVKNFRRTTISKVYNEINVQYDWNPITEAFNFNYAVNNVDEPSFPLETENWIDYVQGVDSYGDAKDIWEVCHEAYLETRVVNVTPKDRSDLVWANDKGSFNDVSTFDKTEEYAYKYFKMTTDWNTRQKFQVNYSVPLTEDTKLLELMQRVRFNNPTITGTENFVGWITGLEIDAKNDKVNIELTMEISKSRFTPQTGDIIEKGTNIDNIIEDAANTESIIEG